MSYEFSGTLFSNRKQNHIFSSNSEDLEAISLHSFTLDSCSKIWNGNLKNINFILQKDYDRLGELNTILDGVPSKQTTTTTDEQTTTAAPQIVIEGVASYYDSTTQQYTSLTYPYSFWKALVLYYEARKLDKVSADGFKDLIISGVKKSSGVTFKIPRDSFSSYVPTAGEPTDIVIVLKFFDRKLDGTDEENRTLGQKASLPIVGQAKTPAGTPYSFQDKLTIGSDTNSLLKYPGPYEDGDSNPKNTVSLPLDIIPNLADGTWSAGTHRVVAILLQDIDAAQLQKIDLDSSSLPQAIQQDFIVESSITTSYIPPTGLAMPLSVQNNDRNQFAPNYVKKCKNGVVSYEPETVIATNRFNKLYKKGDTVFLSKIGKEWIIEKQEQDPISASLQLGEWAFGKMICNSDYYFKDGKFVDGDPAFTHTVTPTMYEQAFEYKLMVDTIDIMSSPIGGKVIGIPNCGDENIGRCYLEAFFPETAIPKGNGGVDIITIRSNLSSDVENDPRLKGLHLAHGYFDSSIFFQLSTKMGGWIKESVISKTNMFLSENKYDPPYAEELGIFWGPVYMDGYRTIELVEDYSNSIIDDPDTSDYNIHKRWGEFLGHPRSNVSRYINQPQNIVSENVNDYLAETYDVTIHNNWDENQLTTLGGGSYKPTINDIPAECTSKIIQPFNESIDHYWPYDLRDSYAAVYPQAPYAASEKVSRNNIQFIPLTANLVGANDINASGNPIWDRNFYTNIRRFFSEYYKIELNSDLLRPFSSDQNYHIYSIFTTHSSSPNSNCGKQYSNVPLKESGIFPYDCYIRQMPTDAPIGAPRYIFDDNGKYFGANCVGIIVGKNTITKRSGGGINFEVTSNFGQNPFRTATPGQSELSILVIGTIPVPFQNTNEVKNLPGIPQFGSKTDSIDSFGTTVLYIRIFDAWPEHLTFFDPRYFAVMHMNNGKIGSLPTTATTEILDINNEDPSKKISIEVDNLDFNTDFRIPTGYYNDFLEQGTKINKNIKLAPKNRWRVNPIRRGIILPKNGFVYIQNKIGVDKSAITIFKGPYLDTITQTFYPEYLFNGRKYINATEYTIRNELKIKLKTDSEGKIIDYDIINKGNFDGDVFPFEHTLPIPTNSVGLPIPGAQVAKLTITEGIVYGDKKVDMPPKEQVPLTRISSSSKSGKERIINEVINTSFNLDPNSTGKYDIFVHFHNDITHTLLASPLSAKDEIQYINMKMT